MAKEKSKSRNLIEGMLIYAIGNFGSKILVFLIVAGLIIEKMIPAILGKSR